MYPASKGALSTDSLAGRERERRQKTERERECGTVVLPSTGNETATTIPGTCRVVLSIGLRYLTMYALGYLCLLLLPLTVLAAAMVSSCHREEHNDKEE